MPAEWTGEVVGVAHNKGISVGDLAKASGYNEKYLSTLLNCENPPRRAEIKVKTALNDLIKEKEEKQ